jgi:large subunit ribosomal protein L24
MKIKVNDNVKVLAGKDKGKTGKVLKTLKNENKVVVEGINISKRHTKPRTNNDKGGIFDIEMPIHVSNLKKIDSKKVDEKVAKETKKTTKKVESKTEAKKETKKSTKKASK